MQLSWTVLPEDVTGLSGDTVTVGRTGSRAIEQIMWGT